MRRSEFDMPRQEEVSEFLNEMTFGVLGTVGNDGLAHLTPLNYVYMPGALYFHGSRVGQKMDDLRHNERASFVVAKDYAVIPSYWSDPTFACPATTFFKSVSIVGTASVVVDLHEKGSALQSLMEKLQPEGGHSPITPDDPDYVGRIKGVAVVKLTIESLSAKFKFGQNLSTARSSHIQNELLQRRRELDPETAELMQKYCPAHRKQ